MVLDSRLAQPTPFLYQNPAKFSIGDGSVAVITRASRAGPFLGRCIESVRLQTYQKIKHVIVLNGPEAQRTNLALVDSARFTIIRTPSRLGRSEAANLGLESSESEFVLLLDDDDTIAPTAIEEMVSYLRQAPNLGLGGVATWVEVLHERAVREGQFDVMAREVINGWMRHISLTHLLRTNCIFTNGFLYRRLAQLQVGTYNPSLPVVEDWEFNIRFLMNFEIGVLARPLSFYHIRSDEKDEERGNSLVSGQAEHERYDRMIRNSIIRSSAANPQMQTLAVILALGRLQYETGVEVDRIQRSLNQVRAVWRYLGVPFVRAFRSLPFWAKRN